MPPLTTATLTNAVLTALSARYPDPDRGSLPPAYTLDALAEAIGFSRGATRRTLAALQMRGTVKTRIHRPSGRTLYKLADVRVG